MSSLFGPKTRKERDQDEALTRIFALLAQFWHELLIVAVLVGAFFLHPIAGPITVLAAMAAARQPLRRVLHAARIRRAWTHAVLDSGAADPPPMTSRRKRSTLGPRATRIRQVPAGDQLEVRIGRGDSYKQLAEAKDRIASRLHVSEVRIRQDPHDAGLAHVTLVRGTAFDTHIPWPLTDAPHTSIWDPVPVGVDELGDTVTVPLEEKNMLIGGEPGSGKSVQLNVLIAFAALAPDCELWLIDGKGGVELQPWAPCARAYVGPPPPKTLVKKGEDPKTVGDLANGLLEQLHTIMDERYARLLTLHKRKVEPGMGMPLHVLIVDEFAFFFAAQDKKKAAKFTELLRDLIARGRAAGIIVIAATQKPSADVIPTAVRDLFAYRYAMRCTTQQASDTILGMGWAANEYDASRIRLDQRGVGLLLAEGEFPRRVKGCWLDDAGVERIASRAAEGRAQAWPEGRGGEAAA